MLEKVKIALRITASDYDDEILMLIDAAREDLRISGVSASVLDVAEPSPLIERAIVTYCKAHFGMDNPDSEKFIRSFESLERHLALSSDYGDGGAL